MEWVKLGDYFETPITGEWGENLDSGESGSPVIRTTNFTNEGKVNYDDIALRKIDRSKKENKLLKKGDIIIEKSGGTPTTPVGRVVYFEGEENRYFVNNFTAILRAKKKCNSKYLFYLLFYFHKVGLVLKYQNKTTGIINLKLKDYLKRTHVELPDSAEQEKIVKNLETLEALIAKRREQIDALDALVDSVFYDLIFNESDEQIPLGELMSDFLAGKSLAGEKPSQFRVLKTSCVYSGYFDENEWKFLPVDYKPKEEHIVKSGDILVSRMNTEELVGASAYVDKDYDDLAIPDRLWILRTNEGVSPVFLWNFFQTDLYRGLISRIATGTSGSMKNISKKNFSQIQVPLPKMELQNRFADYVTSIEAQKESLRTSLSELETLFDALMQAAFSGHLN